jgi:hypothetical protein
MNIFVPIWFVAPWLVFAAKLIHVSIYEWRVQLFAELPPFAFSEMRRRIRQRRGVDVVYNRIKASEIRWFLITACWWLLSFVGLLVFALLYAH